MGIVYHSHYIVWFEIGRTEYCRAAGAPYRALEESGLLILVTGITCRYRRPARYDDEITVATRLSELSARGLVFSYEIRGGAAERLAEGESRHVVAAAAGRPRRAGNDLVERLHAFRDAD